MSYAGSGVHPLAREAKGTSLVSLKVHQWEREISPWNVRVILSEEGIKTREQTQQISIVSMAKNKFGNHESAEFLFLFFCNDKE